MPMINEPFSQQAIDYRRVEQAIRYLEENFQRQPSLAEIAASVHLSQHHFERLFKQWAGVTPIQFLQYLTLEYAKTRLAQSRSLLETTWDVGLSGPGRLHDLFVTFTAVTPGAYKQGGAGLLIQYGVHPTPFGPALLATTSRGVCALRFVGEEGETAVLHQLQQEWPLADWQAAPQTTGPILAQIFSDGGVGKRPFHLYLKGTNFQVQVWQALLALPPGALVSYSDVARLIGRPDSVRAVAGAIAHNPIGYLIPCHRVINQSGKFHQYRWGAARKKAMVGWEATAAQAGLSIPPALLE
jgi:AraC family transcriptional regulator, regulatory protein of adaptative response / methylated-DNA-[protein]-cysteine methyltransferase